MQIYHAAAVGITVVTFIGLNVATVHPLAATALAFIAGGAVIDARSCLLPDAFVVPAMLGALAYAITNDFVFGFLGAAVLAAPLGIVSVWSRGTQFGWGDVKVLGALGALFGPKLGPSVLALAAFSGCVFAALSVRRPHRIPFGPHLALAALTIAVLGRLHWIVIS